MDNILIKPVVTEKMTALGEKLNRYAIIVDRKADKPQIKKAVEEHYKVKVETVNTMNYKGKRKSRYTKSGLLQGRDNHFKKAIITLKDGERIDFFSSI
ncbi:MAG: 50S ribosomal protein L23 [Prevotellaceae bacterium]|jgi:large subunit ribosomal protein L23|nr:50S ribosomal protein L23 [Prevotellaceae bacterium]